MLQDKTKNLKIYF